jgi:hypothetical protein
MGLDQTLVDFFSRTALGTASVLAIIVFIGLGIRRRSTAAIRRTQR